MDSYRQRLGLDASPAAVYAALTEPVSLRGWWTEDCDVERHLGGVLQLRFGPHHKTLRITALEPNQRVHWHCTAAHLALAELSRRDEWLGTDLQFQLRSLQTNRTQLDFTHVGLLPTLACCRICSDGWQHSLASLRQYLTTGRGTPYHPVAMTATS